MLYYKISVNEHKSYRWIQLRGLKPSTIIYLTIPSIANITITMIESLEDNHLLQKNILLHNSWSKVVAKGWQSWEEEMDRKIRNNKKK